MSLYSLILENHTVFMNRMRRGKLPLPKEELEAEMFEYIIEELEKQALSTMRFPISPSLAFKVATIWSTGIMQNLWSRSRGFWLCGWDSLQESRAYPALSRGC